jgi:hypothetical protein
MADMICHKVYELLMSILNTVQCISVHAVNSKKVALKTLNFKPHVNSWHAKHHGGMDI